jgi:hypothetical protein
MWVSWETSRQNVSPFCASGISQRRLCSHALHPPPRCLHGKYLLLLTKDGGVSFLIFVLRVPDEEDQGAAGLLLRTYSAGPVSPICNDLKG